LTPENLFPNDVESNYMNVIQGIGIHKDDFEQLFHYLTKMSEFCEERNIRLIVSIIPPKQQITKVPIGGVFQERVSAWCAQQGVICLNPLECFRNIGEKTIYLSWDPHFTVTGHRVYAQFLYDALRPILAGALTRSVTSYAP
jgi:hypothetical protein